MTQELRERVGDLIAKVWDEEGSVMRAADAAIAIIRAETLEEAAKVADELGHECEGCGHLCGNPETDLAIIQKAGGISCCPERKMRPLGAAIRALNDKP